jgi:hypothetical protein
MAESLLIRQLGSDKQQHVKETPLLSWTVQVEKDSNTSLGLKAKKEHDGLLILAVSESGALSAWNQENPSLAVLPGDKIIGVNGDMDNPWHMIESMWQSGSFSLQVSRKPTEGSNFKYVDNRCVLASEPVCASGCGAGLECLPYVCVREASNTVCTVCFEEYTNPDARLVQLPCKHSFHPSCIAMWFEKGKRRCPMCNFCVESGVVFGKM